ncbi:MAG TPA: aspartate kinase [Chlorobiota bacterium]|nr:aspartate kinase [Chlorobiota bacterium]
MSTNILVRKFGGTSVQDASALRCVLDIVKASTTRQVIVLSATSGTTDTLLRTARAAGSGDAVTVDGFVTALRERHLHIVEELLGEHPEDHKSSAIASVTALLDELHAWARGLIVLGECTPQSLDAVASFGERLSTTIFAAACSAAGLRTQWFDVRTVMRTDDRFVNARVITDELATLTRNHLLPLFNSIDVVVTQGFIGSTSDGRTTTLGRGGSDYTGALLGAALDANEIQIWTDVSGIYSTDPRLVPHATPVDSMSFAEVRELALYGAKVVHPDTIAPAIEKSIPVRVLNTFRSSDSGTLITAAQPDDADVHAATILRGCLAVFGQDVHFEESPILAGTGIEHALTIYRQRPLGHLDESIVTSDVAVICLCGPRASSPAVISRMTDALRPYSVKAVIAGLSSIASFFVVDEDDAVDALKAVHDTMS